MNNIDKNLPELLTAVDPPFYVYDVQSLCWRLESVLQCLGRAFPENTCRVYLPVFVNSCLPLLERLVAIDKRVGLLANTIPEAVGIHEFFGTDRPPTIFAGGVSSADAVLKSCRLSDRYYAASVENLATAAESSSATKPVGVRVDCFGGEARGIQPAELRQLLHERPKLCDRIGAVHAYIGPSRASYSNLLTLAQSLVELSNQLPRCEEINFSGGWPFDYQPESHLLPEDDLAFTSFLNALSGLVKSSTQRGKPRALSWEPGKFLFAPCGSFACTVVDVKRTGTLMANVHVEASFTHLPSAKIKNRTHRIQTFSGDGVRREGSEVFCRLQGVTGLSTDTLLPEPVRMRVPEVGDIVVISDTGAYGRVGSYNFLGLQLPPELLLEATGIVVARNRQSITHLLDGVTVPTGTRK